MVSISKALKEMISRPEVSETIFKSRIDVNLYLSSAKRFADTSIESVELVTRLAAPEKRAVCPFESFAFRVKNRSGRIPGPLPRNGIVCAAVLGLPMNVFFNAVGI